MTVGDRVETTVGLLALDDRVLADASCGQYERGWWASDEDEREYFVSDEGIVYEETVPRPDGALRAFDRGVGEVERVLGEWKLVEYPSDREAEALADHADFLADERTRG